MYKLHDLARDILLVRELTQKTEIEHHEIAPYHSAFNRIVKWAEVFQTERARNMKFLNYKPPGSY